MTEDADVVYQLRVVLAGISPLIWRRLLVPAETSIAGLHAVLRAAFGWSGEHLHRFVIHGVGYGLSYIGGPGFRDDPRRVRLSRFGLREGERFTYEYDFFSEWRHDIRVETILPRAPGRRLPACVGGARAGPPEDCGGPRGYLALRWRWPRARVAARMAEILAGLLDAPGGLSCAEAIGERREELESLLLLSRLDDFDRAALNRALDTLDPDTEGPDTEGPDTEDAEGAQL